MVYLEILVALSFKTSGSVPTSLDPLDRQERLETTFHSIASWLGRWAQMVPIAARQKQPDGFRPDWGTQLQLQVGCVEVGVWSL